LLAKYIPVELDVIDAKLSGENVII